MYLALPDFSKSLCSSWSDFQILPVFTAFCLILMMGGACSCLFLFVSQVLPALLSCADCVSESIWVGHACMQSESCTCRSHLRTFSFIDKSVTIFTLEKKEEQMVVYSKVIISKKKSKTSFTVCCGYKMLAATWRSKLMPMRSTFSQRANGIMDTVPS